MDKGILRFIACGTEFPPREAFIQTEMFHHAVISWCNDVVWLPYATSLMPMPQEAFADV